MIMENDREKFKNWKNVIEMAASGKPKWDGGAWTIAFVYSNQGNFIVKGYYRELSEYLEKRKKKGLKYFINFTLYSTYRGKSVYRNIWRFYKKDVSILEPYYFKKYGPKVNKWKVIKYKNFSERIYEKEFKRLPKRWIKEFDKL